MMAEHAKWLVFSDDWGRHPSSCQHLIQQLLPFTAVTWVNTVGMRPPRPDRVTLARGGEKLWQWLGGRSGDDAVEELPANLTVRNPRMWPWMSHAWDRALNARLLSHQLRGDARDAVAVTTIPIVADLVNRLPACRWVYYCVDDFSVWPGLAGDVLQRMERQLLSRVDRVIAASDVLAERCSRQHDDVALLTHGVDVDFWQLRTTSSGARIDEAADDSACDAGTQKSLQTLAALAMEHAPLIVFWGVVDQRLAADWVLELADQLSEGKIVLAGPQQQPDVRLATHPRVHMPGPQPLAALPNWAAAAAVLIMPYADLPVTRAMQPLKLKEYLATQRPVVASRLPSVEPYSDSLIMVEDAASFVSKTKEVLEQVPAEFGIGSDERFRRRDQLTGESWREKAKRFEALVLRKTN